MQNIEHTIVTIALGQDHTLALTNAGVVLSWGFNRFAQLGYVVEAPDQVQAAPRAILGPLKKERLVGIAACKTASACWTAGVLYTWGRNGGQLGYDKTAHPTQVLPRIVTKVTKPVIQVAMTVRLRFPLWTRMVSSFGSIGRGNGGHAQYVRHCASFQ
jgi:alpha-tubulin suppressor-like RCC1 family protein